jgi:hypothetical protein
MKHRTTMPQFAAQGLLAGKNKEIAALSAARPQNWQENGWG